MTALNTPTGFIVVLDQPEERGEVGKSVNPRYSGVDRVPSYPSDYGEESDAIDKYVFGDFKDTESNVIVSLDEALELLRMFSASPRHYEIIFCCDGPESVALRELGREKIVCLGYDIATTRGDGWSIVGDFCAGEWAARFAERLNEHGLFNTRSDAESYLREYKRHRGPDHDMPFCIVYVARYLEFRIGGHP